MSNRKGERVKDMPPVAVRLPRNLRKQLEKKAKDERRSLSAMASKIVEDALNDAAA